MGEFGESVRVESVEYVTLLDRHIISKLYNLVNTKCLIFLYKMSYDYFVSHSTTTHGTNKQNNNKNIHKSSCKYTTSSHACTKPVTFNIKICTWSKYRK